MRKILMSEKGEFKAQGKADYFRSTAVKKMASVIKKKEGKQEQGSDVVISNKARRSHRVVPPL